jgi:hypothetical protein
MRLFNVQYPLIPADVPQQDDLRNISVELRKRIFVEECGISAAEEFDEYDNFSSHIIGLGIISLLFLIL